MNICDSTHPDPHDRERSSLPAPRLALEPHRKARHRMTHNTFDPVSYDLGVIDGIDLALTALGQTGDTERAELVLRNLRENPPPRRTT